MLTNKDMNKNVSDMKMSEIEKYVTNLKDTVYYLISILEQVKASSININDTLEAFNTDNKKKASKKKPVNIPEQTKIEENIIEEDNDFEDNISNQNDEKYIYVYNYIIGNKHPDRMLINDYQMMIESGEKEQFLDIISGRLYDPSYYSFDMNKNELIALWDKMIVSMGKSLFPEGVQLNRIDKISIQEGNVIETISVQD